MFSRLLLLKYVLYQMVVKCASVDSVKLWVVQPSSFSRGRAMCPGTRLNLVRIHDCWSGFLLTFVHQEVSTNLWFSPPSSPAEPIKTSSSSSSSPSPSNMAVIGAA